MQVTTQGSSRKPVHPGAFLGKQVLPSLGISMAQAARELGVNRETLRQVVIGDAPVTPSLATRLGRYCGNAAEFWLLLQHHHDLWHAKRRLGRELAKIPRRGRAN